MYREDIVGGATDVGSQWVGIRESTPADVDTVLSTPVPVAIYTVKGQEVGMDVQDIDIGHRALPRNSWAGYWSEIQASSFKV